MEWIQNAFEVIEPTIWSAVGLLLLWLIGKLLAKMTASETLAQVVDALRQGVDKAQEEFVTWHKRASEDGKLTREERYEAMRIAYRHAMEVVKGPAAQLLATWGWEKVQSIIKQLVEKKKAAETTVVVTSGDTETESEDAHVDDSAANAGASADAGTAAAAAELVG